MARCPFAEWKPISGDCGAFVGGPFKIVHHTTEGAKAADAFTAFKSHKSDPHFTVDGAKIYQHVDTSCGARALRNDKGGKETNRDSAIQIEVVGFAGARKNKNTMKNVGRLCRWIEAEHKVPRAWPSGPPKPAVNGKDPGGHNRNAQIWDTSSGHFGHCHVPENIHWDPAYDSVETGFLFAAEFGSDGKLRNEADPKVRALLDRPLAMDAPEPQVMFDHSDVGEND